MSKLCVNIFGRRPSAPPGKYLIEVRLSGHKKKTLRSLKEAIERNFDARMPKQQKVPHITIVGPCHTRDGKKLIKEVQGVVKKYDLVGFRFGGFGIFPGRAVYASILPSEELMEMRAELVKKLEKFCEMPSHDHNPEFSAHATLCLNSYFSRRANNNIDRTFDKILEFLGTWKISEAELYVLRVAIIGRDSRIVCEYDLMLKKMLNRSEALDRKTFKKTMKVLRKKRASLVQKHGMSFGLTDEDDYPGRVFVVSDLHFDHQNIISFCNRPFGSVDEMNRRLVENWNSVVDEDDRVYFLGDMTYGRRRRPIDFWLSKLNGEVRFIRGNHDTDIITRAEVIKDRFPIRYKGHDLLLMHDPYRPADWDGWIIHGDKHNNNLDEYPHVNTKNRTINVCAELVGYTPMSLDEAIYYAESQSA